MVPQSDQSNIRSHQIAIRDRDAIGDAIFPPPIEPVARARFSLQTGRESERLSLEKVLGRLIVGIDDDSTVETQAAFHIFHADVERLRFAGFSILPVRRKL